MVPGQFRRKGKHPERNRNLKMGSTLLQAHNQWKIFEEGSNETLLRDPAKAFQISARSEKGSTLLRALESKTCKAPQKIPARPRKGSTLLRAPNPKTCKKISRCALSYFQFHFLKNEKKGEFK